MRELARKRMNIEPLDSELYQDASTGSWVQRGGPRIGKPDEIDTSVHGESPREKALRRQAVTETLVPLDLLIQMPPPELRGLELLLDVLVDDLSAALRLERAQLHAVEARRHASFAVVDLLPPRAFAALPTRADMARLRAALMPCVSATKSGVIPIGSMITRSVTKAVMRKAVSMVPLVLAPCSMRGRACQAVSIPGGPQPSAASSRSCASSQSRSASASPFSISAYFFCHSVRPWMSS